MWKAYIASLLVAFATSGGGTGRRGWRKIVQQMPRMPSGRRVSEGVEGSTYSDANKNSGIEWNESVFSECIKDRKAKIPGTKMSFAGLRNEQEIKDLTAFLKQFGRDGKK
jgi:cytochrome c1